MSRLNTFLPALLCLFLSFSTLSVFGQKTTYSVTRASGVDRSSPINNVSADGSGNKWIANKKGVFQVKAADLGTPVPVKISESNVLQLPGGNTDFSWSTVEFETLAKGEHTLSAAWYESGTGILWVGTEDAGLYRIQTKPEWKLLERINTGNSKLKSDNITIIFQDKSGRTWIGTDNGLLFGTPGKWRSDLDGYPVRRIRQYGTDIYVLADGDISKAAGGERWSDLNFDTKAVEGEIMDFDFSSDGGLWLLSEVVSRFDLLDESYQTFGGPEYYTSQYGNRMAVDSEDAVWIGTSDKGLYLIEEASSITVNCILEKEISCAGDGKDAAIRVKVSGGEGPYTYKWKGGLNGETPQNVAPGTYELTVTDSKGLSKTSGIEVPNGKLSVSVVLKRPESGPGKSDGLAEVSMQGGIKPFSYKWDNGETANIAQKLKEGPHVVTVTDNKGCAATATINVSQQALPLTVNVREKVSIKCGGVDKATLVVEVEGGKGPYMYQWSNPDFKGVQPTGVVAGEYELTVTDANNVKAGTKVTVKQSEPVVVQTQAQAPASTGNSDGKALATAKGGSGTFSYKWDNGENKDIASKLAPGMRSVTVTDANGCTATAQVEIPENILPLSVKVESNGSIKCFGEQQASLSATVNGGKAPFQYKWSSATLSGDKIATIAAGDYSLTVTDASGKQASASISVKEPAQLTLSGQALAPATAGSSTGKAEVSAKGGTGAYTYTWDNGEKTAAASKLTPGQHSITVSDANGCTAKALVTIPENILPLVVKLEPGSNIKCAGEKQGSIVTKVEGGKTPWTFQWSDPNIKEMAADKLPAGDYTLTVTDAAGSSATASISLKQPEPLSVTALAQAPASTGNNDGKALAEAKGGNAPYTYKWDNGESGAAAAKLAPGERNVVVTDANGCSSSAKVTITENILPLVLKLESSGSINCAGEKTAAISALTSGGKGPFSYAWSQPGLSGDKASGLAAGTYQLTVSDAAGNQSSASVSINQPEVLRLNAKATAPASTGNSDGKGQAEAQGGTAPYSYKWDNGETSATAVKLAPGKHRVTLSDAKGCSLDAEINITENILPLLVKAQEKAAIKCGGRDKAALNLDISGGKPPYTIVWNNPALSGQEISGLAAGEYRATVTDALGVTQTAGLTFNAPDTLKIALIRNLGATSEAKPDGKAAVKVSGGTAPFVINWDTKQSGPNVSKLPLGAHTVTVSDANGCAESISFNTQRRALPELSAAVEEGQSIKMRLLSFRTDSYTLDEGAGEVLDELYEFLLVNDKVVIEVGGHTNNLAEDKFADELSTNRAKAVADYLYAKGIDTTRVQYKGYGKRYPIASNLTPEGRKTNQRVEIKILKAK